MPWRWRRPYRIGQRSYSMEQVESVEAARRESADPLGRYAKSAPLPARGKIKTVTSDICANVFILKHRAEPLPKSLQVEETARMGTLSTAKVPLSKLKKLTADPLVRQVALGQGLRDPNPVISTGKATNPGPKLRAVRHVNLHKNGRGVLVGIIDVQGLRLRPFRLRDQRKDALRGDLGHGRRADGTYASDYGRVISRTQMNKALAAQGRGSRHAARAAVRRWILVRTARTWRASPRATSASRARRRSWAC